MVERNNNRIENKEDEPKYKATATGPSNIAITKYWGQADEEQVLANNDSISITLEGSHATTTVHFSKVYPGDSVTLRFMDGEPEEVEGGKKRRVTAQLDRLRKMAGVDLKAKVLSHTNFPEGAGIASSAAGFSALTLAASQALGLSFDKKQLSIQTRLAGSGSACRSVFGGYVRWRSGDTSETSYAEQIAPPGHWSLRDIVAVVSEKEKKVSSLAGHQLAPTSPYYKGRLEQMEERNEQVQTAIMSRDLKLLGLILERDAIDLHLIAMSSNPPIYYWEPSTVLIMNEIRSWREEGLDAYFTLDAGSTVHTICQESDEQEVISRLKAIKGVRLVLSNRPGPGVSLSDNHLF